jgi:hypothetical protein
MFVLKGLIVCAGMYSSVVDQFDFYFANYDKGYESGEVDISVLYIKVGLNSVTTS